LYKKVSINSYQVKLPYKISLFFFFRSFDFARLISPYRARSSSSFRFRDHTQTHHTRYSSSRGVISPSQRPLPDNTQQSQETGIHATGGIRTRNPRKRVAEDRRLRPRGHRSRPFRGFVLHFMKTVQLAVTVIGQSDSRHSSHYHEPIVTGKNDSQKAKLIICVSYSD
jgi:hypothetical protein